jgi:hypothetical protein
VKWRVILLRPGVDVMDSDFLKQRAAHCRFLAERVGPFVKRRFLDLAAKYEARFPEEISINLTSPVVPLATPHTQ